jgi:hypothetical protein
MAKQTSRMVIPAIIGECCQSLPIRLIQLGITGGTPQPENYELREDGGIELRENDSYELRES